MSVFPSDDTWIRGEPRTGGREPGARSSLVGWILLIGAVAGTVVLGTLPAPLVLEQPGPVYDTIGEVEIAGEDTPVIEVDGEKTYPTDGRLYMLTVSFVGNPQAPLSWIDVAIAWFDPQQAVLPVDLIYPPGQSTEETVEQDAASMAESQQDAVAAALAELGIEYQSTLTVERVVEGTPADGLLQVGDQILTVDGVTIESVEHLRSVLAAAGVGTTVRLGIVRVTEPMGAGQESGDPLTTEQLVVSIESAASDDGSPIIGIVTNYQYDFPFEVTINLADVGGPSAGMMLALGTYDKLTPGAITGGEQIAGTGTITGSGEVGPIGGIRQKLYSAQAAGADWFLAPATNCNEVIGHIPGDLQVFAVASLDDAIRTVETIAAGDDTSALARCEA